MAPFFAPDSHLVRTPFGTFVRTLIGTLIRTFVRTIYRTEGSISVRSKNAMLKTHSHKRAYRIRGKCVLWIWIFQLKTEDQNRTT